ncbi:MAG: GNAT family N-acetyltransferase [Saprospiraceae bacterium]
MNKIITTKRLYLREANLDDAKFIFELLNSKGWIDNIGDRGIRTIEDAQQYINNKLIPDYGKNNIAMFIMERKEDGVSIGTCGLIKRPQLEDVDIGFAILEEFGKKGYAYEAASATLRMAVEEIKITRIVGITTLDNKDSQRLLEKIGLAFEKMIPFEDEELMLFSKG